jgi:hypothetical protein
MKIIGYFTLIAVLLFIGICWLTFFAPASTWVIPEVQVEISDSSGEELSSCVVSAKSLNGYGSTRSSKTQENIFRVEPVKVFRSQGFGNPALFTRVKVECDGYLAYERELMVDAGSAFEEKAPKFVLKVSLRKNGSSSVSTGKLFRQNSSGKLIDLTGKTP